MDYLKRYERRAAHEVRVGEIKIGGNNPIAVQSMTNTPTADIELSVEQGLLLGNKALALVLLFLLDEDVVLFLRDALHLLFHAVGDVLELLLAILKDAFLLFVFRFKGVLLAEDLVLALKQYLLLLCLSFLAGLVHDAAGKVVGFAYALAGDITLYENAYERAEHKGHDGKDVKYGISHNSTFDMLTGLTPIVPEWFWTRESRPRHEPRAHKGKTPNGKGWQEKRRKDPGMP